jgi:hypothetical protein
MLMQILCSRQLQAHDCIQGIKLGTGNRVKSLISSGQISNRRGIEFGTDAGFHLLSAGTTGNEVGNWLPTFPKAMPPITHHPPAGRSFRAKAGHLA